MSLRDDLARMYVGDELMRKITSQRKKRGSSVDVHVSPEQATNLFNDRRLLMEMVVLLAEFVEAPRKASRVLIAREGLDDLAGVVVVDRLWDEAKRRANKNP